MVQRVRAEDGWASGSAWFLRHLRSISASVPLCSAASCRRRVAAMGTCPTSPTTAASPPCRKPSSMTASTSSSRRHSAWISRSGVRPAWASPGANRSRQRSAHSTIPPLWHARAASPAVNRSAAASSPMLALDPAISCSAPSRMPPPAILLSIGRMPNGRLSKARTQPAASIARTSARSTSRRGLNDDGKACTATLTTHLFSLCSDQQSKESIGSQAISCAVDSIDTSSRCKADTKKATVPYDSAAFYC